MRVCVWSQPAHVFQPARRSPVTPACADEAEGRAALMRGKPEGPFCEYVDEGHV